uniref:NAD(+) kinase n=1 Tax=Panagrolaimus sp. ES5 TaxID=591445 RepID=A0AC34GUR5_9BILA
MGLAIDDSRKNFSLPITHHHEFGTSLGIYENYELHRAKLDYAHADSTSFRKKLKKRGTNFDEIQEKDKRQQDFINAMKKELEKDCIQVKIATRQNYTKDLALWSNLIISAGGDGTFLTAASKVRNEVPVIGMNTDPVGSEGHLCLTGKQQRPADEVVRQLLNGEFQWTYRQRIRVTIIKSGNDDLPLPVLPKAKRSTTSKACNFFSDDECEELEPPVEPMLALNEVFIGESHAAKVSYYEVQIDDGPMLKQKSSGLIACTGTGSTSWNYNINKLSSETVKDIMSIMYGMGFQTDQNIDEKVVDEICQRFNSQLIFEPTEPKMAFTVRDPVFNATFPKTCSRGFANKIRIKSRCSSAHLVLDGSTSIPFNQGTEVLLELIPEDALQTVILKH